MTIRKYSRLWGMDEAGRGALAGPLVAAAVQLSCHISVIEKHADSPLRDSKTLSASQRIRIYNALSDLGVCFVTSILSVEHINAKGIGWCNRSIFENLIRKTRATRVIIDGNLQIKPPNHRTNILSVVNADATIPEVICAGIVAKVTRDTIMTKLHSRYPSYQWSANKGYGTKRHIAAISTYGQSPFHRILFVKTALITASSSMHSTSQA